MNNLFRLFKRWRLQYLIRQNREDLAHCQKSLAMYADKQAYLRGELQMLTAEFAATQPPLKPNVVPISSRRV